MRILGDRSGLTSGRIFNLGNPRNFVSVRGLVHMLIEELAAVPGGRRRAANAIVEEVSGQNYYGKGYEDVLHRRPSIVNAMRLGWMPQVGLREGLRLILAEEFHSRRWGDPDLDEATLGVIAAQ
jgi:nucleoside-diphosphate-sugar epimerase